MIVYIRIPTSYADCDILDKLSRQHHSDNHSLIVHESSISRNRIILMMTEEIIISLPRKKEENMKSACNTTMGKKTVQI